jgi:mono/diheme cytochrome c family protein
MIIRNSLPILICAGLVTTGAFAQTPGNPNFGKVAAQQFCSDCHAIEAGSARSPDPKAPPFTVAANTKGMSAMALSVWLQTGHPTMPNIRLQPDTLDDIVAYIMSLRSPRS